MRKLFLLSTVCLLALVGCQKDDKPTKPNNGEEPKFENVNPTEVTLPEEGGDFTISYTLTNPIEGETLEPVINVEWITLKANETGSLTFTAAANTEIEPREASIFVAYADVASFTINISQAGAILKYITPHIDGQYFGTEYSGISDNYYFYLSDKGFDAEGYGIPGGTYFHLDLYSEIQDLERGLDGYIVPAGTYTFDAEGLEAGTFSAYTSLQKLDDEGNLEFDAKYAEGGEITVTENGIIANLIFEGVPYLITFEGVPACEDGRAPEYYTTLTGDYQLNIRDDASLLMIYYGDFYDCGYDNYLMYIQTPDMIGDMFQSDIVSGGNEMGTSIAGTYNVAYDAPGQFLYIPGYVNGGYMEGTWFFNSPDGQYYGDMAPITGGTIEIAENGDGTVTLTFDLIDDNDNAITGTWTAEPVFETAQSISTKAGAQMKNYVMLPKNTALPIR